jgi:hypothetical protein
MPVKKITHQKKERGGFLVALLILLGVIIVFTIKLDIVSFITGDVIQHNTLLFIIEVLKIVLLLVLFFGVLFMRKFGVYAGVFLYAVSLIKYYAFDLPPNFGQADTPPLSAFQEVGMITLIAFLYFWAIKRKWKQFS